MGHVLLGTLPSLVGVIAGTVLVWALLGTKVADPHRLPLLLLITLALMVITGPAVNALSRRWEQKADEALVRGRFTTPKSRSSRRLLELGPRTRDLLAEQWRQTSFQGDEELVFCHPQKGTPLDPSRLARCYLRPALRQAGIEKSFRPFHDLRHTALTHEAAAGNPMAYVQLKAGHSQSAITERYIHAAQVLFPGAAKRSEERMFGAR
jgi:integrase